MRGFTLVELLVSIGIFVAMTALLVVKYGSFNQGVLLTNLVYDTALVIRTAQTYGLSVVKAETGSSFRDAYGVYISTDTGKNDQISLYSDTHTVNGFSGAPDYVYTEGSDALVNVYKLTRGAVVSRICVGDSSSCGEVSNIHIAFKRPDPSAIMCETSCLNGYKKYVSIDIMGTSGEIRSIEILKNGQISILQ